MTGFPSPLMVAVIGLFGVVVGGIIALLKEVFLNWSKRRKDALYLAERVSAELERFVFKSIDVARDGGRMGGSPGHQPINTAQTVTPTLDLLALDVEWRSIPADIMYSIMDLQFKLEQAKEYIAAVFDNGFPPDYDEGFDARQYEFSVLGLEAW